jgi:D-serine deaminase-like pyridoxal phosphate-dependent protein
MSLSESRACAVVDAGLKAVSLDSGPPQLLERPNVAAGLVAGPPGSMSDSGCNGQPSVSFDGVEFMNGGDEHGKLLWPQVRPRYLLCLC